MSVEKLIKILEEQYSEPAKNYPLCDTSYVTSINNVKKLLAIVKVQNKALGRIIGKCSDYRGWKLAEEAVSDADKIAREGV